MSTRNRLTAATLALVAALVVVSPAAAINPVLVDPTPGITAPQGIFRDGHDAVWVADSHAGVCRLQEPADHLAGAGLVPSPYCDPTGVLVVDPTLRPVAPGQAAFDPSSGDIYVGDLASGSGGVWRLHLDQNADPSVIDSAVKILDLSAPQVRDRVFGMSYYASTKSLDFSTKLSQNIQRIVDPHACPVFTAPTACARTNAGSAEMPATLSLAHDANGNIYIADLSGVTKIANGSLDTQARPVPGLNAGVYTAMAYDAANKRVYAGTTNPEGVDWIDVLDLDSNTTGTYSIGLDGITAISATSAPHPGRLDVVDDPGIKQVGEDLGGTGRRFSVDFEQFVPPPVIIDGPAAIANVRVATFFFRNLSPTTFYCSLDLAPATACGTGTQGSMAYAGLTSGAHSFVLYGNDPVTGPRTIRRFAIDTRAPVASIDTTTIAGSSAQFGLSADDINVDFTCRLDSGAAAPCDTPARYAGLADGLHTFTVHATDFVGNVGAPVSTSFRIGPPPSPQWKAGKVLATLRGKTLRVVFSAPPGATFARFTLGKTSGVKVRTKTVRIKAGKRNTVTIKLTRAEAQRLQRQTVTLKIIAGAAKSALTTKAGQGKLTVAARLTRAKGH
jgi:hypothetical protein